MPDIRDDEISRPPGTATGSDSGGARQRVEAASDQAGTAARDLRDEATGAAAQVKERAGAELSAMTDEARQQARTLADDARQKMGSQADDAARSLASTIADAGHELRSMADGAEQPDGAVAGVVRQLADRTESVAQRLDRDGYRGIADDLARFGRNNPGIFLLAAGAAGFAVGRLLRNADTQELAQTVKGESPGSSASIEPEGDRMVSREPVVAGAVMAPGAGEHTFGTDAGDVYVPTSGPADRRF